MRLSGVLMVGLACTMSGACAPDLRTDFPFDGTAPENGQSHFTFETKGNGVWQTVADASQKEFWVYLDVDNSKEIPGAEALGTKEWDLGFQRFKIISNSGVDGVGDVEVAVLPGQDFDTLSTAPETGYLRDAPDGPDSNTDVDSAFLVNDGWYAYDLLKHKVAPNPNVYVVHTAHAYYKLKLMAYYDAAGTAGKITFLWAPLSPLAL